MSGSLLQRRGLSLGQWSEAVPICVLLGKCSSVPACLAAGKGLTRRVKCSLQAEGIPWIPGPSVTADVFAEGRAALQPPSPAVYLPHHPTSYVFYFYTLRFSGCIW